MPKLPNDIDAIFGSHRNKAPNRLQALKSQDLLSKSFGSPSSSSTIKSSFSSPVHSTLPSPISRKSSPLPFKRKSNLEATHSSSESLNANKNSISPQIQKSILMDVETIVFNELKRVKGNPSIPKKSLPFLTNSDDFADSRGNQSSASKVLSFPPFSLPSLIYLYLF